MKKLTLYVAVTVLYTSFIMIFAVSVIFFLFTYIAQSNHINRTGYTAFHAFLYVLYNIPANICLIMPICGLLGGLMGLGLLSQSNELIVMRASGQSVFQISKGVILTAIFFAGLTFFMGAYIAPDFQKKAAINKILLTKDNNKQSFYNTQSLWIHKGNTFTYIGQNNINEILRSITKYNVLNNVLISFSCSKDAHYQDKQWKVNNVEEVFINRQSSLIKKSVQQKWCNLLKPSLLKIVTSNTNYLNLNELTSYIIASNERQQNNNRVWLKFWQILFQPFSSLILMLISVPFSLGTTRSSKISYKFIIGLLIGFIFYIINQAFGPFSLVYHFPTLLGAAVPSIIFMIILVLLFYNIRE